MGDKRVSGGGIHGIWVTLLSDWRNLSQEVEREVGVDALSWPPGHDEMSKLDLARMLTGPVVWFDDHMTPDMLEWQRMRSGRWWTHLVHVSPRHGLTGRIVRGAREAYERSLNG